MRKIATSFALVAFAIATAMPARAQSRPPIVRDAEIEELLVDYARPLYKAAGLRADRTDIILVNSSAFNAFVSGTKIFIHTGTIVRSETPNEVIGVLAHEIGHLAGGHQDRLRQQLDRAQTIATVSAILGATAAVAAGSAGNSAGVSAGGGLAMGGAEAARRGLLTYQRSEELTADRAAIGYLEKTGQSPKGMLVTFERLQRDLSLVSDRINPYKVSHPLPRERISALQDTARKSRFFNKTDPAALQERHEMARAKIIAYVSGPGAAESFAQSTKSKKAAQYARAIAKFLYGSPREALPMIDKLIAGDPSNPYLHEMKGEIQLKAGDARAAADAFSKAARLDKQGSSLIQSELGHALVLQGDPQSLRRAVGELEVALSLDPVNPQGYRYLAMAYGRLGEVGEADLATAEQHFHSGLYKEAAVFAARAKRRFPPRSPQWLRADDIQRFKPPKRGR
ncbi:M48 family metalloprotease [Oricola sp.]|uniref:M48 family metalloprotease n=1 Tax=Oricola sp. TaxID=1979950 RepID=UPI0025DE1362|nr:M48 family metalloprotease [Oricola sp.]MCI5073945.1 M48 family metalloprotease [Oricola sp.]